MHQSVCYLQSHSEHELSGILLSLFRLIDSSIFDLTLKYINKTSVEAPSLMIEISRYYPSIGVSKQHTSQSAGRLREVIVTNQEIPCLAAKSKLKSYPDKQIFSIILRVEDVATCNRFTTQYRM